MCVLVLTRYETLESLVYFRFVSVIKRALACKEILSACTYATECNFNQNSIFNITVAVEISGNIRTDHHLLYGRASGSLRRVVTQQTPLTLSDIYHYRQFAVLRSVIFDIFFFAFSAKCRSFRSRRANLLRSVRVSCTNTTNGGVFVCNRSAGTGALGRTRIKRALNVRKREEFQKNSSLSPTTQRRRSGVRSVGYATRVLLNCIRRTPRTRPY